MTVRLLSPDRTGTGTGPGTAPVGTGGPVPVRFCFLRLYTTFSMACNVAVGDKSPTPMMMSWPPWESRITVPRP